MTRLLDKAIALAILLAIGIASAKAAGDGLPAVPANPQEAKLIACWQAAKATGDRFTIQEKEALVAFCMAQMVGGGK